MTLKWDFSMIKCVSFDIGGTLVKSRKKKKTFLQQVLGVVNMPQEVVLPIFREIVLMSNLTIEESARLFSKKLGIKNYENLLKLFIQYETNRKNIILYEDVLTVLKKLQSKGILLITISNDCAWAKPKTGGEYEKYFQYMFYSYELGLAKPDIRVFRTIENIISIKANEIVHIGDSIKSDAKAAQNAGWKSILINREKIDAGDNEFYEIDSLSQVLDYIKNNG